MALALALVWASNAEAYDDRCIDQGCDLPFGWEDDEPPPINPPLPQGFVLTVQVGPHDAATESAHLGAELNRYLEVAEALGRCWDPSQDVGDRPWGAITLRVSFKRDGTVNGIPRTIVGQSVADGPTQQRLRQSLLSALSHCTPLHLSPSLGNAIAGQIFAIRFVQKGHDP